MIRLIGFYDYTVILTYLSVISAVSGMVHASRGAFTAAIIRLIFSGVCDMFDGTVARSKKNRTPDEKSFGIQIDSLCDVISFGVFPVMLCYFMGMSRWIGRAILALYILGAVTRLGFFNVLEINRQKTEDGTNKYFRGMPVTMVSFFLPLAYLIGLMLPTRANVAVIHVVMAAMAFLFVWDIRIPKYDLSKLFSPRKKERRRKSAA
ncbi:MAG: CDP-diacylglycerol--serine O-phosphatidyltransferase [Erysipelotrichaceae bacterium]|nr:CDP-diacylglycerol--serine O-phosphatidyltransferase [Erysipelotrichaceae bacterium]